MKLKIEQKDDQEEIERKVKKEASSLEIEQMNWKRWPGSIRLERVDSRKRSNRAVTN